MVALLKKLKDKWWQIALAIGGLAALVFIFACFVNTSERMTVWQFFTAIAASVGIYVANRRAKAMEGTAKAGHDANEQKAYNEAVANLGNKESTSARLGGIYGLFDLAQSKPLRRRNITEILCAHLRETTQRKAYQKDNSRQPSNEVQSLLNVLCELNDINLKGAKTRDIKLNLEQSYLRGANMEGKNLRKAQLHEAKLQGAILFKAELQGAYLWDVQLQGAILIFAKLQGANLGRAGLQGADLSRAELQGADLGNAGLQGARLGNVGLQGARLWGAQLQGVTSAWNAYLGDSFEGWIESRIGEETDLKSVVFSGGLTDEKITEIQNVLYQLAQDSLYDKGEAEKLCVKLREHHLGEPSHKPPDNAITGILTKEMADKIMENYNESLKIP